MDILVNEHRIIEQVLNCLERMVQRCQTEGRLERGPAEDAVSFFRAFAECSHLAKEEIHLFPALEGAECSEGSRCKERMIHDKQQGRVHLREMEAAVEASSTGDKPALKRFVEHAGAYIGLLLKYIENEEDWLFPAAGRILTEGQQRVIAERLKTMETDGLCGGQEQKYVAIANRLADHFGVPRAVLVGP